MGTNGQDEYADATDPRRAAAAAGEGGSTPLAAPLTDDGDTVTGTPGDDTINGGAGDDVIDGGAGDDTIDGGDGDDTIEGGSGNDTIDGASGDDVIEGGSGDDTIDGGSGDDTLQGGGDDDTITGDSGDDLVDGGIGDDRLSGGSGDDRVIGGQGDDVIVGGTGDDHLEGGNDADIFTGFTGRGDDTVAGGAGGNDDDTLDLTGSLAPGASFSITIDGPDSDGNGVDGSVSFFDADGRGTGTIAFTNIENIIPCFTPGTAIATPEGERAVESLRPGDRVITRDNGLQEICWAGQRRLSAAELARAAHLAPVLVRAGALGHGLPGRDMRLSPQHRLLLADDRNLLWFEEREVLVAAHHLVGRPGIERLRGGAVEYVHFMCAHHEVVLSDGAWSESFQPGDGTLGAMGQAQRAEILELFPDLAGAAPARAYPAARRTLKRHEARLLVDA